MKLNILVFILGLATAPVILAADASAALNPASSNSVQFSNADASRLFIALRTTQAGLSALNTRNAALNINALRPVVEAYEAGQQVLRVKLTKLPKDQNTEAKAAAIAQELLDLSKVPAPSVALVPLNLSDEEIKDAKIPPDALAEIIRFLGTASKK